MNRITEFKEKKISRLFWQYALPTIAANIALAVYYIIDSIFIGYGPGLGAHALGGLGVVLPIMNLLNALGVLVGVGTASRISIYLGQNNKEMAKQVIGTSLVFTFIISIIPIVFIYLFVEPILYWVGATEETFVYARDFLYFYLPASLLLNMGTTLTSILKAIGFPKQSMYIIGISVIFNFILAPLFIFVFKWGMKGAGAATSISALIAACLLIPYLIKQNNRQHYFSIEKTYIKLRTKIIYNIINIGFAPFLITAMTSVIVFFTNKQLIAYQGTTALEGYVIATRFHYVFTMIFTGISQGIQPIVGYNYGAKNIKRMFSILNYAFVVAFGTGMVALFLGTFAGDKLVLVFNPDEELTQEAIKALFVLTVTMPLASCQILISGFFQHIGRAAISALLSSTRQIFFFIPLVFILPLFWGVNGVWASLPIAEILASIATFIVFWVYKKRFISNMSET